MNVLDENIPRDQREHLEHRRMRVRQIGIELGQTGMGDDEIIALLHGLPPSTFFTRDRHFYLRRLCHRNYCLVNFRVETEDLADCVIRVLRHPGFNVQRKRSGRVLRVTYSGVRWWEPGRQEEQEVGWAD